MRTVSDRSFGVFPGGSLGEYNLPRDLAVVLAGGKGATVWDVEGRQFTDFTMGWGSAYVMEPALLLAAEVVRAVAGAERVRLREDLDAARSA